MYPAQRLDALRIDTQIPAQHNQRMKNAVFIMALVLACLLPGSIRGKEKPIALVAEQTATMRIGDVAVAPIPKDPLYAAYSHLRPDGDWGNFLALISQSKHELTFRAVGAGSATIQLKPHAPSGQCAGCATIQYFVTVVAPKQAPQNLAPPE